MDLRFPLAWTCIAHLTIFAIILLRKKTNKSANRLLAWFMLNFAFIHATNILVLSGPIVKYHYINEFGATFAMCSQGPLYLWFVSLMTGIKINWKRFFYLHSLPFIVVLFWAVNCLLKKNTEIEEYYAAAVIKQPLDMTVITSMAALQMAIYLIWSVVLLNRYNAINKNKSSNELLELRWLKNLTIVLFIVVFIIAPILIALSKNDIRVLGILFPVMTILIYAMIFYKSINFPGADEEKKLIMQYEREKISRDMHDDLGSGLSKISIISNSLKEKFHHDKTAAAQIEKISKTSLDLVSNMSHMVWAVNPENDNIDSLLAYIHEYAVDFLESCNLKYHIDFPQTALNVNVLPEERKNIFFTIKESLNNIAKHASATHVWLKIVINSGELCVEIKDDGKGFVNNNEQTGNGLRNIQTRMKKIGGTFEIGSPIGKGTTTRLSLPLN